MLSCAYILGLLILAWPAVVTNFGLTSLRLLTTSCRPSPLSTSLTAGILCAHMHSAKVFFRKIRRAQPGSHPGLIRVVSSRCRAAVEPMSSRCRADIEGTSGVTIAAFLFLRDPKKAERASYAISDSLFFCSWKQAEAYVSFSDFWDRGWAWR